MAQTISRTELRGQFTTAREADSASGAKPATGLAPADPHADRSGVAGIPAAIAETERQVDPITAERQTGVAARWGMAAVFLMLAYEWLLSGLNKDFSGTFRSGLANRIHGSLVGNPHGWYVSFVKWAVLPHVDFFAAAVEIGEVLVAAGLIWGAVLWVRPEWFPVGLRPWLAIGVSVALLGSALMELNYYLLAGQGWPWLKTGDPFVEGLSVDGLVMLISLALIPVQLAVAGRRQTGGPAKIGRIAAKLPAWRGGHGDPSAVGHRSSV